MKSTNALPLQGHAPDSSGLCSSSTAWGSQLIVDLAWRPVFYNPGILITLTVTWDCFVNLYRRGKKKKSRGAIRVIENPLVMLAEQNLRNDTVAHWPNYDPQKKDIFDFSELSELPEEAQREIK